MTVFTNKTILITGGTGSFGHALVKRIIHTDVREVRIFSRDELKQDIMRNKLNTQKVKFYIGDVRDADGVDHVMQGVDMVFHAAALKQVPSCEFFPMQAVMTNIIGSNNVIEAAIRNHVKRVVCLSTDKAVYPINAMGMTKALMEKVAQAAYKMMSGDTIISCVRYGNVMMSRGSVIPLFIRQMRDGAPITVTHPDMTRFMLSLDSAIDLVLFALGHANNGDIFIKKAPAATIDVLVNVLKTLFNPDVPVHSIGIRHGEKMFETLASSIELRMSEDMGDYYRVRMDDRDLNYSKYFTEGDTVAAPVADYTSDNTVRLDTARLTDLLMTLPEIRGLMDGTPAVDRGLP